MHISAPACSECNSGWVKQQGKSFSFSTHPEVKVYRFICNVCKHRFLHFVPAELKGYTPMVLRSMPFGKVKLMKELVDASNKELLKWRLEVS